MQTFDGQTPDSGELTLSQAPATGLSTVPPEAELATMRHMMETLLAGMETMQQNQAMQFAGVHDRLDSVELELPLIQEQSALRIRDLEVRMSVEIEEAARSAAEQVAAGIQEEVAGKFGSLASQIESQHHELSQMRESRKLAESKLNRAIVDIERLCANLAARPIEPYPSATEAVTSPIRSRIAEHIRRAAVDMAPDGSNPLVGEGMVKRGSQAEEASSQALETGMPAAPHERAMKPAAAATATKFVPVDKAVPGFEEWKRQFMQSGEPLNPTLMSESARKIQQVICPSCYSERTRPATPTRLDGFLRLAGFIPHRCKSCAYRFYKRGAPAEVVPLAENEDARAEEALESR